MRRWSEARTRTVYPGCRRMAGGRERGRRSAGCACGTGRRGSAPSPPEGWPTDVGAPRLQPLGSRFLLGSEPVRARQVDSAPRPLCWAADVNPAPLRSRLCWGEFCRKGGGDPPARGGQPTGRPRGAHQEECECVSFSILLGLGRAQARGFAAWRSHPSPDNLISHDGGRSNGSFFFSPVPAESRTRRKRDQSRRSHAAVRRDGGRHENRRAG
jgi:hypothetical protein